MDKAQIIGLIGLREALLDGCRAFFHSRLIDDNYISPPRQLLRQRYLLNYGGTQQAKSARRIPIRLSRDSLVFVCDFRAHRF